MSPTQYGCNYLSFVVNTGEITNYHNQMPGTAGNIQSFDQESVADNGLNWTSPTGPTNWSQSNSNSSIFYNSQGVSGDGTEHLFIYDRCNS